MGEPVLIIGETGRGKTYSIRTMDPQKVGILCVEKNRLPFENKGFKTIKNAGYKEILAALSQKSNFNAFVVDDSQYLLVNEFFGRSEENGYKKFQDMATNFHRLVHHVIKNTPDDVIVYFLHHTEYDTNAGKFKAKTVGKMIDQYWTLEGSFNIVLYARVENGEYFFETQSSNETTTAKSPKGMFDLRIPNDLGAVDKRIREYYGI